MRSRSGGAALQQVQILFDAGAVGMLTDAELLDQFISRREEAVEAAFGALLRRHGPMVLGVCRGVLGDRPETEDAFQATFLVLVHRACTVRERDSLGRWLHGVARRIAVRAKTQAVRRRAHLQRFAESAPTCHRLADDSSDEIAMLREEVERLPARFRAPVVLCYLEGLSYEGEALARRVGGHNQGTAGAREDAPANAARASRGHGVGRLGGARRQGGTRGPDRPGRSDGPRRDAGRGG